MKTWLHKYQVPIGVGCGAAIVLALVLSVGLAVFLFRARTIEGRADNWIVYCEMNSSVFKDGQASITGRYLDTMARQGQRLDRTLLGTRLVLIVTFPGKPDCRVSGVVNRLELADSRIWLTNCILD